MSDDHTSAAVSAAGGGVVWRPDDTTPGRVEIALVHRPRYNDWSLPKGKVEREESVLGAAVREVGEEIGAQVVVGPRLGQVEYPTHRAGTRVTKQVTYWSMRYVGGCFASADEVDELAWVPPSAAARLLSYRRDRQVVKRFSAVPAHDRSIVLVRHARAGKRREWRGDDAQRPLDAIGEAQAGRLGRHLARLDPVAVYAADRTRCIETLAPLARRIGQQVHVDAVYSDESYAADPARTAKALLGAAETLTSVVVCSQGVTIPGVIEEFGLDVSDTGTRKAAFWLLALDGDTVVTGDYYEDALHP